MEKRILWYRKQNETTREQKKVLINIKHVKFTYYNQMGKIMDKIVSLIEHQKGLISNEIEIGKFKSD